MKKVIKLLIILLSFIPLIINALDYNNASIKAKRLMALDYKQTYQRYLIDGSKESLPLKFVSGTSSVDDEFASISGIIPLGGLLNKDEFDLSKSDPMSDITSYLYDGMNYWTMTKSDTNSHYMIGKSTGVQDSENGNYGVRVTEFVKNDTVVIGAGTRTNPWIFQSKYRVDINGVNGEVQFPYGNYVVGSHNSLTVKLVPKEGYKYVSNDCGFKGTLDEDKTHLTLTGINKDVSCTVVFGRGVHELTLGEEGETVDPDKIYVIQGEKFYYDLDATHLITKLNEGPTKDNATFKGFSYKTDSGEMVKVVDENLNIINSSSSKINKSAHLITDWKLDAIVIRYASLDGETLKASTRAGTWSKDENNILKLNGEVLETILQRDGTLTNDGLVDYNNNNYLSLTKINYYVTKDQEWKCIQGSCLGKVYSQKTKYSASDFCTETDSDCNIVLAVNWQMTKPKTTSIAGAATKIYGAADVTLTCTGNLNGLKNGATLEYSFGSATTKDIPTNWSSWQTSNKYTISKTAFVGQKYFGCKVRAVYNGDTMEADPVAKNSMVAVKYTNAQLSFNTNGGTISGSKINKLYIKYNDNAFYTGDTNTTPGAVPTATKTGYIFNGWSATQNKADTKIINTNGTLTNTSVSGFTDNGRWSATTNKSVYALWNPKTIEVTFNENYGSYRTVKQTFTYGVSGQKFADTGFTRTGNYVIYKWCLNADLTGTCYDTYSAVQSNWIDTYSPSVTLYARWARKRTCYRPPQPGGETCTIASTEANLSYYCPYSHDCLEGYDVCWCTDEANGGWQYASKKYDYSCGCYKWYACKSTSIPADTVVLYDQPCPSGYTEI